MLPKSKVTLLTNQDYAPENLNYAPPPKKNQADNLNYAPDNLNYAPEIQDYALRKILPAIELPNCQHSTIYAYGSGDGIHRGTRLLRS